jgi:hypothetical protein
MNKKMTPEDIADLPPELVKQLAVGSRPSSNSITQKLIALVEAATEPLNTNQLLIGMYRTHGKILKRNTVQVIMSYAVKGGRVKRLADGVFGPVTRANPT